MDKIIFFTALVVFPFGQLLKLGIFNLFDALVLLLAVITFFKKPIYPEWYRYFIYFIISCVLGLILNYPLLTINSVLYLVRLVSYSLVAVYISNYYKKTIINSYLLILSCTAAVLGWLQYLLYPDLTSLKYLGWDDHLLRMIGTFLDPTFLGLILVLGIIIAIQYKYKKIVYFLLFSLAFTYSRSSYLVASLFLLFKQKYIALIFFVLVILVLPKNIGEGTTLTRTVGGNSKLINYQETIEIVKQSPVFGVGFNNICSARQKYLNDTNSTSHACNGADSSILFMMATTGIVGTILFLSFVLQVTSSPILLSSFLIIILHSVFSNSLFYPHIMFWLFTLVGLQTKTDSQRS
ncbi:MAG: O-antigen ligase family protein [Patescibacteria group bacterium]